jgi:hypothetical protein
MHKPHALARHAQNYLIAVFVLIGLLITKYIGWWWTDISTSLVLAAHSIKEGLQAL